MSKISDQAIFDLAADLFKSGEIRPEKNPTHVVGEGPDLSKIKLSDYDIQCMMEGRFVPTQPKLQGKPEVTNPIEVITEDNKKNINELIVELTSVITQAVKVIQELTSCGMIGTNQAVVKPQKQKPKVKPVVKKKKTTDDIIREYLK